MFFLRRKHSARVMLAAAMAVGLLAQSRRACGAQVPCDIDKFAAGIKQAVHGKCTGYSVAIYRGGKLAKRFAGGMARLSVDSPARGMSVNDQIELGSISKTINAMVLLKALEEKGISIETSISGYLPSNWPQHSTIKSGKVTFHKLLRHTSGLKQFDRFDESKYGPGNYNDHVKEAVKLGVVQSQSPKYNNTNYELIRVLLAYVVNKKTAKQYEAPGKVKGQEIYFSSLLAAMANNRVFSKGGVLGKPKLYDPAPADKAIRYYHFPTPTAAGRHGNDRRRYPGRGGWKMTAAELAAVLSAWNTNKVLSPKMTADMKKLKLGVFNGECTYGTYYGHNGKSHNTKRSGTSQYIVFPGNIVVTLLLNSAENAHGNKTELLRNAFENACKSADLVVTKFKAAGKPKVQGKEIWIPVHVEVRNQGKATANGKFAVAVKRLNTWRWVTLTATLTSGKSRTMQGIVKIPKRRFGPKTIKLVAMADAPIAAGDTSMPKWGRVKESNESNNTRTLSVQLPSTSTKVGSGKTGTVRPKRRVPKRPVRKPVRKPIRKRRTRRQP